MTSERWAGFTDEDIERIKLNPNSPKICSDKLCEMEGYTSTSRNRGPMKIKKIPLESEENEYLARDITYEVDSIDIKTARELSVCNKKSSKLRSLDEDIDLSETEESCTCSNYVFEDEQEPPIAGDDFKRKEANKSDMNLLPLEIFELKQKRIEAENARRRALISKAINDKKMHTQAEAIKLAKITQELNHIDSSFSSDVSILRNYIEKASFDFSEAEKQYLKAEKEFVEAKLLLFEKMQRKEMLTEHLCAIIEQNENRKADKLVELMKQLEMEVIVEDSEINEIPPILPNLCALNNEPYHTCQMLKPSPLSNSSLEKRVNGISQTCDCEEKISHEIMDKKSPNG